MFTATCTSCGAALEQGAHFCANCGQLTDSTPAGDTARATDANIEGSAPILTPPPPSYSGIHDQSNYMNTMTPPEYQRIQQTIAAEQPVTPTPPAPPQSNDLYSQYTEQMVAPTPPPPSFTQTQQAFTQPPMPPRTPVKPKSNRKATFVALLIIFLVALVVTSAYALSTRNLQGNTPDKQTPTATSTEIEDGTPTTKASPTPTVGKGTPTPGVVQTTPINAKVVYAGVEITIFKSEQNNFFSLDHLYYAKEGAVRISLRENNPGKSSVSLRYSNWFLVKPDGTTQKMVYHEDDEYINSGINRENWVEFAYPYTQPLAGAKLRIGAVSEYQIEIPLMSNPDTKAFQSISTTPGSSMTYRGVDFTLEEAIYTPGYNGTQAKTGMVFIVLHFKIVCSGQGYSQSYSDYVRLKVGETPYTITDEDDFPYSFTSGSTKQATLIFSVPPNQSGYTLVFNSSYGNASLNFSFPA